MIAWTGLKREESGIPYPVYRCLVEVIELHELRFATMRPDDDVVAARFCARKELWQGVLELRNGLLAEIRVFHRRYRYASGRTE
jgi:hypothetical protein